LQANPDRLGSVVSRRTGTVKNEDGTPKFSVWTSEEWAQILTNINQLESSVNHNPHNLRIPRLGANKIPWLWRRSHCPQNDVDYRYIFEQMCVRLKTWTDYCNQYHETTESPATLYLEECVQWLETGGKCHMFGFVKTMLPGHVASSSWGRGVSKADGTLIMPGDPMATGCTVLFPTDMSKHYDLSRRTVINESWKANALRFCYRPSKELIPTLLDTVKSLQEKTSWYREVSDDYPSIPMPTSYKDLSEWKIAIQALVSDDDVEKVDDEEEVDGEDFDDEVNVYLTRQRALQSIFEPSADMPWKDEAGNDDSDEGEVEVDSEVTGGRGEGSFAARDGGGVDHGHVRELRVRYDEVVRDLVTNFDRMLGDARVNDARKALETAVMANDGEAFEEAYADRGYTLSSIE
jgi:hypothetical protein